MRFFLEHPISVVCTSVDSEPGVLLVNPVHPCLKVNDVPVGWEYFSQRGWDVFEVPPPVTISGWFCNRIRISALINYHQQQQQQQQQHRRRRHHHHHCHYFALF